MEVSGNLNGRVLNAVIDFDMVVNTELGLIRFIRENYQDARAFNLDILNKSDREILSLLFTRKHYNPLSVISTEENLPDIDELYNSFFENFKKEILKKSVSDKNTFNFISLLESYGTNYGINAMVAVRDNIERDSFISHFPKMKIINKSDKQFILSQDIFYINDYRFFTENGIDKLLKKKIYILAKQYSFDYFDREDCPFTGSNVIMIFGKNEIENSNNEGE